MDPDGTHQQILAHGLRNAVDLQYIPNLDRGSLFATNMGDDHLGERLPEDTFFELDSNRHPGPITAAHLYRRTTAGPPATSPTANPHSIPRRSPKHPGPDAADIAPKTPPTPPRAPTTDSVYGKQSGVAVAGTNLAAQIHDDANLPNLGPVPEPLSSCKNVPPAYTTFFAHSSPLGLAWFAADNPTLTNTFLVALHGASRPRIGTGYRVVRFSAASRKPEDVITGFLTLDDDGKPLVHGRPCGILSTAPDAFFLTDDYLGLIYYIFPKSQTPSPIN